ncbi:MAG: disulfide isomerase [Ideonella sp. MAG2]|nr:MAG: disulfide isomerase [Ideonella sp. MAG2]
MFNTTALAARSAGSWVRAAALALPLGLSLVSGAQADEASIRKNLADRMANLPRIDEISKTPIPGIYELRMGTDILYSDEDGTFLIEGALFDTRSKTDITKARMDKLTAVDFAKLPLKDAIVIKQGNGSRKMVVFSDPNCGYCKKIERDLVSVKDVTIYTYLIPILGADSVLKTRDIWCSKEQAKTWRSWMLDGQAASKAPEKCDTAALDRNMALARKHKIQATPAVIFEDGSRAPGAIPAEQIEKLLASAKRG